MCIRDSYLLCPASAAGSCRLMWTVYLLCPASVAGSRRLMWTVYLLCPASVAGSCRLMWTVYLLCPASAVAVGRVQADDRCAERRGRSAGRASWCAGRCCCQWPHDHWQQQIPDCHRRRAETRRQDPHTATQVHRGLFAGDVLCVFLIW